MRNSKNHLRTKFHDHKSFGEEFPEFAHMAIKGIADWEQDRKTLVHAVGEALRNAYERGRKGLPPPEPDFSDFRAKGLAAPTPEAPPAPAPVTAPRRRTLPTPTKTLVRRRSR